jgi:hypothetical protein
MLPHRFTSQDLLLFFSLLVRELVSFAILIYNTLIVFAKETKATKSKVILELRFFTIIFSRIILLVSFF